MTKVKNQKPIKIDTHRLSKKYFGHAKLIVFFMNIVV